MSDEQLNPFPEPRSRDAFELDPTAEVLRRALHREADQVRPSTDGLSRIMATVEAEHPGARRPGRAGYPAPKRSAFRRFTPLLAAAAAAGVLAVAGTAVIQVEARQADQNQPAHTGQSGPPAPSGTASAPRAPSQLAVYVVGQENGEMALFREFRTTNSTDLSQRVSEALTDAVLYQPADSDYETLFTGGRPGRVVARVGTNLITVQITAAMATRSGATLAEAKLAMQQLVWTATAAAERTVPIQVTVSGGSQSLFGLLPLDRTFTRRSDSVDPRAPVWIISLADGTTEGRGNLIVTGDAVSPTDRLDWTLTRDRQQVQTGTAQIVDDIQQPVKPGTRGNWSIPNLDASQPGHYELTVQQADVQTPWFDTKSFVVN
jgi:hypothetical protein